MAISNQRNDHKYNTNFISEAVPGGGGNLDCAGEDYF